MCSQRSLFSIHECACVIASWLHAPSLGASRSEGPGFLSEKWGFCQPRKGRAVLSPVIGSLFFLLCISSTPPFKEHLPFFVHIPSGSSSPLFFSLPLPLLLSKMPLEDFPDVPVKTLTLKALHYHCRGMGSIPGQGTKIPCGTAKQNKQIRKVSSSNRILKLMESLLLFLKKKNAVKIAKFIEAEGRMVVTRGWREKLVKVYKV